MRIYIKYLNNKYKVSTKEFESINSIINKITSDSDNYILDCDGITLNKDFSLEKYNINSLSTLTMYPKLKGGNSFFTFVAENPTIATISFIIVLIPIILLPLGFVPTLSSLIEVIIQRTTKSIGKYLVCDLGKTTLYNRMSLLIWAFKYATFLVMIFVIISFPLIVLCITLKGHSVMDDPKSMCSALSVGKTAGFILTAVYALIYMCFRGVNWVIDPLISLCKQVYILNTLVVPFLSTILSIFNKIKYMIVYLIPFIGAGIGLYFTFLSSINEGVEVMLSSIIDLGCNANISMASFKKKFMSKVKGSKGFTGITDELGMDTDKKKDSGKDSGKDSSKNNLDNDSDKDKIYGKIFGINDPICDKDMIECCNPKKFIFIADSVSSILESNSMETDMVKQSHLFPVFVIFCEALYDSALSILDGSGQTTEIQEIKVKLENLETTMINFSKQNHSSYIPGNSLFKSLMKIIFVKIFCNVSQTAKTSKDVISQMGQMTQITDMLKAGTTTGFFTSFLLIICGIFNVF